MTSRPTVTDTARRMAARLRETADSIERGEPLAVLVALSFESPDNGDVQCGYMTIGTGAHLRQLEDAITADALSKLDDPEAVS